MVVFAMDALSSHTPWALAVTSSMSALIVILLIVIARQPQSNTELAFKVRWLFLKKLPLKVIT